MKPFEYTRNGITRTVIDIKPFTTWQYIKTYGLILLWTLVVIYLVFLGLFCPITIGETTLQCPYLTTATAAPVIMLTIFTFLWTFFTRKKEVRKNHIYEE